MSFFRRLFGHSSTHVEVFEQVKDGEITGYASRAKGGIWTYNKKTPEDALKAGEDKIKIDKDWLGRPK